MARESTRPPPGQRLKVVAVLAIFGLVGAAGLFVLWQMLDDESAGPDVAVTVADIDENSDTYLGEEVTVSAEVISSLVPSRAFWIGDDDLGGPGVLVIAPDVVDVDEDAVVRVTGTVRNLESTELADELGLAEGIFGPYEGENIIRAEEVDRIEAE